MAVIIDVQAFRDSLPSTVYETAGRLRDAGAVGSLEPAGGGVQAVVRDGSGTYQPWVGVVDRALAAECDCSPAGEPPAGGWCPHAVAVARAAFAQEVRWSGAATPPSADQPSPELAGFLTAVGRLAPRQLTALVVDQAAEDRRFATRLLRQAGMLAAPDRDAVEWFDHVLREVGGVTRGDRWEIHDIEAAGYRLAAEVAILCEHPATPDTLERVEQALLVWDGLSGHLLDAYHARRTDPEQIGRPLLEAHLGLCAELELAPAELARRLTALVNRCDYHTVDTEAYADLLGDHPEPIVRRSYEW